MKERIKAKARIGAHLTDKEKAYYVLFIASEEEADEYIKNEF